MKVLALESHIADALRPSAVVCLGAAVSSDLRIVLTLIKYAENMAQLTKPRGTKLTRLATRDGSDFHYGTPVTGVVIRPIDEHGSYRDVDDNASSLSTVSSVAILAVGLSLKEAIR